jgi:hypothetical protein
MPSKSLVILTMSIGSVIGGYAPTLIGIGVLSLWSLVGSFLGGGKGSGGNAAGAATAGAAPVM